MMRSNLGTSTTLPTSTVSGVPTSALTNTTPSSTLLFSSTSTSSPPSSSLSSPTPSTTPLSALGFYSSVTSRNGNSTSSLHSVGTSPLTTVPTGISSLSGLTQAAHQGSQFSSTLGTSSSPIYHMGTTSHAHLGVYTSISSSSSSQIPTQIHTHGLGHSQSHSTTRTGSNSTTPSNATFPSSSTSSASTTISQGTRHSLGSTTHISIPHSRVSPATTEVVNSTASTSLSTPTTTPTPASAPPMPPPKSEDRVPRACIHCRNSKLKCDSVRPCSRCVHANRAHLCIDAVPLLRGRKRANPPQSEAQTISTNGKTGSNPQGSSHPLQSSGSNHVPSTTHQNTAASSSGSQSEASNHTTSSLDLLGNLHHSTNHQLLQFASILASAGPSGLPQRTLLQFIQQLLQNHGESPTSTLPITSDNYTATSPSNGSQQQQQQQQQPQQQQQQQQHQQHKQQQDKCVDVHNPSQFTSPLNASVAHHGTTASHLAIASSLPLPKTENDMPNGIHSGGVSYVGSSTLLPQENSSRGSHSVGHVSKDQLNPQPNPTSLVDHWLIQSGSSIKKEKEDIPLITLSSRTMDAVRLAAKAHRLTLEQVSVSNDYSSSSSSSSSPSSTPSSVQDVTANKSSVLIGKWPHATDASTPAREQSDHETTISTSSSMVSSVSSKKRSASMRLKEENETNLLESLPSNTTQIGAQVNQRMRQFLHSWTARLFDPSQTCAVSPDELLRRFRALAGVMQLSSAFSKTTEDQLHVSLSPRLHGTNSLSKNVSLSKTKSSAPSGSTSETHSGFISSDTGDDSPPLKRICLSSSECVTVNPSTPDIPATSTNTTSTSLSTTPSVGDGDETESSIVSNPAMLHDCATAAAVLEVVAEVSPLSAALVVPLGHTMWPLLSTSRLANMLGFDQATFERMLGCPCQFRSVFGGYGDDDIVHSVMEAVVENEYKETKIERNWTRADGQQVKSVETLMLLNDVATNLPVLMLSLITFHESPSSTN